MTELRDLTREYDGLLQDKSTLMLAHRVHTTTSIWQECYYSHPNPKQASGLLRRAKSLSVIDADLGPKLVELAERLVAKAAEVIKAREAVAAARQMKKTTQQAKKAEAQARQADPYRGLHPQIAELLRQVAEPYRVRAVASDIQYRKAFVERFKKAAEAVGCFNPIRAFKSSEAAAPIDRASASEYVKQTVVRGASVWSLREDLDGYIQRRAEDSATSMVASFVNRVGTKLTGIVERKGNLDQLSITGSLDTHWMRFTFKDGSEFQVQSQVVWVWNRNGTMFSRFPVCFRRVILPSGEALTQPSEAKMLKAFVPPEPAGARSTDAQSTS